MLILNWWTTLDKLVTMATRKRLPPIYKIKKFAYTYLGRVTKFQANGLFLFGVLSHLLGRRCKPPLHPGRNEVKRTDHDLWFFHNIAKKSEVVLKQHYLWGCQRCHFWYFQVLLRKIQDAMIIREEQSVGEVSFNIQWRNIRVWAQLWPQVVMSFDNVPYSSFRLKTRLQGQNYKNVRNFCVTIGMASVFER